MYLRLFDEPSHDSVFNGVLLQLAGFSVMAYFDACRLPGRPVPGDESPAAAFLINAASFVISAALVSAIEGRYCAVRPEGVVDRGSSEGFRFVLSAPALWLTLVATTVGLLGTGMINVAEYPLFVDMGGGSQAYGVAVAGWAVGGFIAGRTMRKHGDAYTERSRLLFGRGLVAIAIGLCGVVPLVGAVVVLFSIGGFAAQTRGIAATLIYQRSTPDHIRARAFAALGTANRSAIGVAMIVSGAVLETLTGRGLRCLRLRRTPRAPHRDTSAATPPRPRGYRNSNSGG